MEVVTAPDTIDETEEPKVFLAGGITNCDDWQSRAIDRLKDFNKGVLFNPRRNTFDINNPNAATHQIEWEFAALNECDIFSMFFCNTAHSDQPICFYELGRYVTLFHEMDQLRDVLIGIEPGFRREKDVRVQMELISPNIVVVNSLEEHIENIKLAVISHVEEKLQFISNFRSAYKYTGDA